MNRAFGVQFHNGEKDQKVIVSLSCKVLNGRRYKGLDETGKKNLISEIEYFQRRLDVFKKEIQEEKLHPNLK